MDLGKLSCSYVKFGYRFCKLSYILCVFLG